MVIGSNILAGASGQGGSYTIPQSLRFNDDDTPYMQRTPSSAGNTNTWTFSVWVKRGSDIGSVNTQEGVIGAGDGGGSPARYDAFNFYNDNIQFSTFNGNVTSIYTSAVFRDPSAWYHVVIRYDDTQATAADRVRIYVNGVVQALNSPTYPSQNYGSSFNNTYLQRIGANAVATNRGADGYLSEIIMVDGQSLDPTSFGKTNAATGQWVPIEYTGSMTGNSFYITGADSADLGADYSGLSNDFTSSGLSSDDAVLDSPTANLPTFNPLSKGSGTLSDGNLQYVGVGSWTNVRLNLLLPETGKWAVRFKTTTTYQQIMVGVCAPDSATTYGDLDQNGVAMLRYNTFDGNFVTRVGGSRIEDTGPPTVAAQTWFQLLFDMDTGQMGVAADGATSGTLADISTYPIMDLHGASLSTARQIFALVYSGIDSGAGAILDAGQSGWTPAVTGFSALTLANLSDPTIALPTDYFQTVLDTGANIKSTAEALYTDQLEWIKDRDNANNHQLIDSVRGTSAVLQSNSTGAETTYSAPSGNSVGWVWKANGTGSSNSDGSVISTVSANTTAGFSIVTYTGTGSAATIGHGLGVAPDFILVKKRVAGTDDAWIIWHQDLPGPNYYLNFDTGAQDTSVNYWNNTLPTSSVFSVGASNGTNQSTKTFVAYLWNEVEGFSKFVSYEGNASTDGPFIYCGFRPSFVMIKNVDAAEDWWIQDAAREPYNSGNMARIAPNSSAAESDNVAWFDFVSNGLKVRYNAGGINSSGTHIVAAFAESPFKTANAR